jgi:aminocarboxymuconate-semialdehyde decarboxylase
MPNRRDFLRAIGSTGAGAYLLGHGLNANAQSGGKQVVIGGQEIKIVDIHAHCVFREVADVIAGTDLDRQFPDWYVLGDFRMDAMDERGIDVAALSVNNYWWYAANEDLASAIVRTHDESMAAWCDAHPDRFVALTSPALQYPELAAEQVEYAVNELGHRGVSVGGTVLGEANTIAKYDPFWAKVEELDVPVFMHPSDSVYLFREGALPERGGQGNILGNPFETTFFLSNLIFNGTLDRFPGLRVCGAHGGGYLPSYIGRTDFACERDGADCLNERTPSEYLRRQILADTMVFSAEGLRHLVAEMGADQLVYGSDQPFFWPDTIDIIVEADFLTDVEKEVILGGNLRRLLRIES